MSIPRSKKDTCSPGSSLRSWDSTSTLSGCSSAPGCGGGGIDGAFHTHGDAVKYYLEGKGKEIIDDQEVEVSPGDLAFIPANIWHGTENTGDEPMVFIAFHQIPGTHLPVPASWQYHADDLTEHESIDSRIATMANEDPAAMDSAVLYSWRQHLLHELGVLDDEFNVRRKA